MDTTTSKWLWAQLPSDEQDMVKHVAELAQKVVAPEAIGLDTAATFPTEIYQVFQELGLVGLLVPEEHGGLGASVTAMALMYEELAKASATVAAILSNSIEALVPIAAYSNPALRDEVLTRVLHDGEIPCFGLTEPTGGSDATAIATRAEQHGSNWRITGRKCFITNGSVGNLYLVFAMTDPEARKSRRLSAFVVDRRAEGFSVGADEVTMGLKGSPLSELILDGVEIPTDRMVGERGQGLEVAMRMLNESRVGAAAQCVGICADAVAKGTAYAVEREAFGQRIGDFQAVQLMLADMATRTEASRHLTLAAASAHDDQRPDAVSLSAMCKAFASDAAVANALDVIQVYGGLGFCSSAGAERLLRDAKAYQIFDGTNQIQRLTIAKQLLRQAEASQ